MISQIQDLVVTDVTSIPESNVIGFDYSRKSDVKVKLGAPGVSDANLVERTFTTEWTITSNNRVQLEASLFSGTGTGTYRLQIFRQTDASPPVHVFQPGSSVRAQELNAVNQQALHVAEEVRDTVNSIVLDGYSPSNVLIDTSKLAPNAITTDKIQNGEVKEGDIDTDAVTTVKIADSNVTTAKIADSNITTPKIANSNVTTDKLADDSVTPAKLSHTTVAAGSYTAADITVDENGRLTSAATGTIATSEIENGAVTLAKIDTTTQVNLAVPVGTVLSFAAAAAPAGYLICNGDTIPNGTGTVQSITADFSALYGVIGATLPSMLDSRFVLHSNGNIRTNFNEDWKSFTLRSQQVGNYTHEGYMGKSTTTYLPTVHKWTAGNSGTQWGYQLKWDGSDVRPKCTVLLPIIKF